MSDDTQTKPEFDQGALYFALKNFLVKKGYLSEAEADPSVGEWTLVHNASWSAYSMNKLGVSPASVPWNYESIPAALLADEDFVLSGKPEVDTSAVTSAVVEQDAANSEPVDAPAPAPALAPASNTFVVDRGENLQTETPVPEQTAAPAPAPGQTESGDPPEGTDTGESSDSEGESLPTPDADAPAHDSNANETMQQDGTGAEGSADAAQDETEEKDKE